VIGNVAHTIDVRYIQYSLDRRVPLLHIPAVSGSPTTHDGQAPTYDASTHTGDGLYIGASGIVAYKNSCINILCGTEEMFFKPDASVWNNGENVRWFSTFARPDWSTRDNMRVRAIVVDNTWVLEFSVYDSFGGFHNVQVPTPYTVGAWPNDGAWHHLRARWEFNKPGESRIAIEYDGTEAVLDGQTIVFGMLPTVDLKSVGSANVDTNSTWFSNLHLGRSSLAAGSTLSDIRILDVWEEQDIYSLGRHNSGWQTVTSYTAADTRNMFKIDVTSLPNDSIQIMRVRAVDVVGNTQDSSFFNTDSCRPILIRGSFSGVQLPSETVYRFRLVDSQGEFPDYLFPMNPTEYGDANKGSENISFVSSITGKKIATVNPPAPASRGMAWNRISREFYLALRERAESGNSFFLIDHNDEVMYGKFQLDSVDEITATVPSSYRVSATLTGQGSFNDYRMG
jgi:hypothetical protein